MKRSFLLFISALLIAACSSPKYTYHFDTYDYNSGKKKAPVQVDETLLAAELPAPQTSPLMLDPATATANASGAVKPVEPAAVISAEDRALLESKMSDLAREYKAMSKSEKREFRKELKKEVKNAIKAKKSGEEITSVTAAKQMDQDLKMALIFAIVAIILSALGGVNSIFWILGVVAWVVALVFLIKWIAEQ